MIIRIHCLLDWRVKKIKASILRLVHTSDISNENKASMTSGTCEDKITIIFLCFAFCSALGLCLNYDLMLVLMLMTILMSQAWLHSFVLSLCLCYRVNQALSGNERKWSRWIQIKKYLISSSNDDHVLTYITVYKTRNIKGCCTPDTRFEQRSFVTKERIKSIYTRPRIPYIDSIGQPFIFPEFVFRHRLRST